MKNSNTARIPKQAVTVVTPEYAGNKIANRIDEIISGTLILYSKSGLSNLSALLSKYDPARVASPSVMNQAYTI